MAKFKSKIKDNHLYVVAKLPKEAEINTSEVEYLSNNFIRGILKPELKSKHKLYFVGPIAIPLRAHLIKPMARYEFFLLVVQILDIARRATKKNLFANKIVYDLNQIYINQTTKELQFVYLPLKTIGAGCDLLAFLREFTYQIVPMADKDSDYLSQFLFFLNGLQKYDADKIEAYIRKEDRAAVDTIRKQDVGNSGYMTNKQKDFYEHYDQKARAAEDATGLLEEDEDTGLLQEDTATGLLVEDNLEDPWGSDATGLLEQDNETGLLDEPSPSVPAVHYPILRRMMSGEEICINKPVFRIGKEKSYVDYFIANNNAVSRSHADIITRGSKYFIIDLNSKNRTYVNGQVIPIQHEIEIYNNDRIKLANEEFIFLI